MTREVDLILIKDGTVYNVAAFDADGYMPSQTQPDPTWGYYVERTEDLALVCAGWSATQAADGSWSFAAPAAPAS
ncbi:hypothetical protein [Paraburkholderia solisilvae]|uniref:Uncharacterized protein n=1 Tax=Paraburkholderia solisilvae TaxID=624376 RepID=A0A6J5DZC9_9BURK|nr:hypothetical protein [Paraburkholderia solisilvae]CAB3759393.1 hypothetical protein LMG29739_03142 [Paraburkholderia solisilvae]